MTTVLTDTATEASAGPFIGPRLSPVALLRKAQAAKKAAVSPTIQAHLDNIITDAALPGLRGEILKLVLPMEVSSKVRRELGAQWTLGEPLPPHISPETLTECGRSVRTLRPMTVLEFIAKPGADDQIHLVLRLDGQISELTTTAKAYASLGTPIGEWTNIFGSATQKRTRAPRPR